MEEKKILVKLKDIDLGVTHVYLFTTDDAKKIVINTDDYKVKIVNGEVYFNDETIGIRTLDGGGLGTFNKVEFIRIIKDQLE